VIYVWHHVATLVLAAGTAVGLASARWVHRSPRAAMFLWHATAFSAVTAALGILLSLGLAPYGRGILPSLGLLAADLATGRPHPGLTPAHVAAVVTGVLLAAAVLSAQARSSWEVHKHRARHRLLLHLVARPDADRRALVLDHPAAAAYYLPGRPGRVVVSSGTLTALTDDELAAVLAHEHAHARGRHHLVLAPFHALRRAIPCRATERAVACVELLAEMGADDRAVRDHGPAPLVAALQRFHVAGTHRAPHGTLAAADKALALRIERLRPDQRPLASRYWWGLGVAALAVSTTPASLFVFPA
jgi:Peptidase family M48